MKKKQVKKVREKENDSFTGWTHRDNFLASDRLYYGESILFSTIHVDKDQYVKVKVTKI